jgi:hypothetical protein
MGCPEIASSPINSALPDIMSATCFNLLFKIAGWPKCMSASYLSRCRLREERWMWMADRRASRQGLKQHFMKGIRAWSTRFASSARGGAAEKR